MENQKSISEKSPISSEYYQNEINENAVFVRASVIIGFIAFVLGFVWPLYFGVTVLAFICWIIFLRVYCNLDDKRVEASRREIGYVETVEP